MIAKREISDYRIQRVINLVEDEPKRRVKDLACLVNLSASRLEHLFKEETGNRLSRFIQHHKLERASELLRSTPMQVKEISYTVGYEHSASFVRAFKEKFQLTPKTYRGLAHTQAHEDQLVLSL